MWKYRKRIFFYKTFSAFFVFDFQTDTLAFRAFCRYFPKYFPFIIVFSLPYSSPSLFGIYILIIIIIIIFNFIARTRIISRWKELKTKKRFYAIQIQFAICWYCSFIDNFEFSNRIISKKKMIFIQKHYNLGMKKFSLCFFLKSFLLDVRLSVYPSAIPKIQKTTRTRTNCASKLEYLDEMKNVSHKLCAYCHEQWTLNIERISIRTWSVNTKLVRRWWYRWRCVCRNGTQEKRWT